MITVLTVVSFICFVLVTDALKIQAQTTPSASIVRAKIFCRTDSVETGYLLSADSDTIRLQTTQGLKSYHLSELNRVVIIVNRYDDSYGYTGSVIGAIGGASLANSLYSTEIAAMYDPDKNQTFKPKLPLELIVLGGWLVCIPLSGIGMALDDYFQKDGNTIIFDCTGDSISLAGIGAGIRRYLNGEDPVYRRWRLDATAGYVLGNKSVRISKAEDLSVGAGNIGYTVSTFNMLRTLGLHYRLSPKFECGLSYVNMDEPPLYGYVQVVGSTSNEFRDNLQNTGLAFTGNYRLLEGDGLTGGQWFECVAGAAFGISAFERHNILRSITNPGYGTDNTTILEESNISRMLPFVMGTFQFSTPLIRAIRFGVYADYVISLPVTVSYAPSSGIPPSTITVGNACIGLSVGARF